MESQPWETRLQEVSSRPSPSRGLLGLLSLTAPVALYLTEKCTSSPLIGAAPVGLACPRGRQPGQRRDHAPVKRAVTMTPGLHMEHLLRGTPAVTEQKEHRRLPIEPFPAPVAGCDTDREMPLQGSVDSTMLITTLNPQSGGLGDVQSNMGKGLSKIQPGSGCLHRPSSPSPTL